MSVNISKRFAVNSIYSLFLQTNENITFHHVLQRIGVLLQDRVTYILFKKYDDGVFRLYYPFVNDPVGAERISKSYHAFFGNIENPTARRKKLENYLFRILESDYYLFCVKLQPVNKKHKQKYIFLEINSEKHSYEENKKIREEIIDKVNSSKTPFDLSSVKQRAVIVRYILDKVFTDKDEKHKEADKNIINFESIEHNFIGYREAVLSSIKNLRKDGLNRFPLEHGYWYQDAKYGKKLQSYSYNEAIKKSIDEEMVGKEGAIEVAFRKIDISLSKLLPSKKDENGIPKLTNFLLFTTRSKYKGEESRDKFNHGLKISIPFSQQKQFQQYHQFLKEKGESLFKDNYFSFKDAFFDEENIQEDNTNLWIEWFDKEFWNMVLKKDFNDWLEVLTKDFSPYINAIADVSLFSHLSFYPFPFEKSGLFRVLDEEELAVVPNTSYIAELKKKGSYEDGLKLVSMYYLMFGMMPLEQRTSFERNKNQIKNIEDLALSLTPLSVQGVSYCCIAHYASLGDSARLKSATWQRSYNLFNDIDIRFRRGLRQQIEKRHLRHVRETTARNLVSLISGKGINDYKKINIDKTLNKEINDYIPYLPVKKITLSLNQQETDKNTIKVFNHGDTQYFIAIKFEENPYFLKFFEYSPSKVEKRIKEAIESGVKVGLVSINMLRQ